MPASDHDIERLETLIAYADANAEACREAADEARQVRIADPLVHRAQEREAVADHLRQCLREAGGDAAGPVVPDDRVAVPASGVHQAGPDDIGLVEAAERDEVELHAAFASALDDDALSAPAREVVMKAYVAVRTGGDQMHDLRRSLRGGA